MKELISLYDNFLIYHPNYFFSVFFLSLFLVLIFLVTLISSLPIKKVAKSIGRIRSRLKLSLSLNLSTTPIIRVHIILEKIIKALWYIEIKIEKILKRIAKIILAEE